MEGKIMLRPAFVGAILICLPLAACAQSHQDEAETPMFSAVHNSSASVAAESTTEEEISPEPTSNEAPSPTQSADKSESCEDIDADEAYQSGIGSIAPWNDFGWQLSSSSGFDPCADLSWQIITVEGATASSPHHIMLFHKGEYLGTATFEPYGFFPTVERVSDAVIAVTYHWAREGETTAGRTGETHAGFRWDEDQQKTIMSGDVPPN